MIDHPNNRWQQKMQKRHAIPIYKDYWRATSDDIEEVDSMGETNDFAKRLDYSGLDKLIHDKNTDIHLAQRFRRPSRFQVDFSLRMTTTGGRKSEYYKLQEAYENGHYIPTRYAFGVGKDDGEDGVNEGFDFFCLIDNRVFVQKLVDGEIEPCETHQNNGDNKQAAYFSLDKLRKHNLMIREWDNDDFEQEDGQSTLARF